MIAALAGRQHGVVARWQLLEAGITRHQIATRLASGRLHEIHRGVYLVGHKVPPPYAMESAAILAFRGHAVLSHASAGALWKLLPYPAPAPVCVTVAPGRSPSRPRIRAFRAALSRRDIRRHHGLPVTSPPRTILDLAADLPAEELEAVVAEAEYRAWHGRPSWSTSSSATAESAVPRACVRSSTSRAAPAAPALAPSAGCSPSFAARVSGL